MTIISSDSDFNTHSVYTNHIVSFKADGDIEIDSAGAILYDKSEKILKFGDNYEIRFGAGSDFLITHTGSNTFMDNATGDLYIRQGANDKDVIIQSDDGSGGTATYFLADGSTGAAELYHYGSKKFETTSTGASITGNLTVTGQLATGQAVLRDWSSSDTDIDALMGGSTFGNII